MSDHATEAARNFSIKENYPTIDDPIAAINFAVDLPRDECQDFLKTWQEGGWAAIEDYYHKYLGQLPKPNRAGKAIGREASALPSKE